MSSSIYLYAELLLNIRQVSLVAILPSNCNEKTRIWLGDDRRTLKLRHEDEEAIIELPCPVVDCGTLKIHSTSTRELSLRLAISNTARLPIQVKPAAGCGDPWLALGLTPETHVACKSCRSLLVKTVNVWKHLPSAGWADMMDFWHCHKPSANTANDKYAGSSKGYAAANALSPAAGTGLVDVSHFLVSCIDCIGIETTDNQGLLRCSSCRENVGVGDEKDKYSLRLFKWSVALQRSRASEWETCSLQHIVSAQLLALIDDLGAYKFLAIAGDAESSMTALLLWAFTPDLMYSTSMKPTQRAMKILYRTVKDPAAVLERNGVKIEELNLPLHALKILQTNLETSTNILPQSIRTHSDWNVGLLDRWSPVSSSPLRGRDA